MSSIVLQVMIHIQDGYDVPDPSEVAYAVEDILVNSGELSGQLYQNHHIKDIDVAVEDVV